MVKYYDKGLYVKSFLDPDAYKIFLLSNYDEYTFYCFSIMFKMYKMRL